MTRTWTPQFLYEERGSAVIEIVILALPLFLPIIIYFGVVGHSSMISADIREIAQQSARAYITSPSQDFEDARLQTVINTFSQSVLIPDGIHDIPTFSVTCSSNPCLTPESRIEVTIQLSQPARNMSGIFRFISVGAQIYRASDTQIVDAWR
jgi:Flp pilus assembly protein TadG